MKIETCKLYTREEVSSHPNKLYIFGENSTQKETSVIGGGQAVIRGLPNTFGLCTLTSIGNPWSDDSFESNKTTIDMDVFYLKEKAKNYETIVFPEQGLGTGRACLQKFAPKTMMYLCSKLLNEFNYNNLENLISKYF